MSVTKMTVAQWLAVPDNPRQRDTVSHAEKATKHHLKDYSATQASVAAAVLPGGRMVKLDGHTRALLWSQDRLHSPPFVEVSIYLAKNMEEAKELYTHFDNRKAGEDASDVKFGAFREAGIAPTSGLIKHQNHASVFRNLCSRDASIYKVVSGWKREIVLLDAIGFPKNGLKAGGVLGALVLLRFFPVDQVTRFLTAIRENAGTKTRDGMDSVQMYITCNDRRGDGHAEVQIWTLAGRMVALYKTYASGRRYVAAPSAVDVKSMLAEKLA